MSQGAKSGSQLPGRRRPDFFIVGAPRSGTSSLYNYLIQHPGVFMPELKEPHFFYNRESPGAPVLGAKDLEAYLSLFGDVPEEEPTGEASTSYLWLANAAREIRELQPEAKVMMVLRNPVDRAYSHYWYQVRRGGEKARSFEEALADEPKRIRRGTWHGFYYVDCGRYGEQVSRYLEVFGREAVRVYLLEDLRRDARGVYRDAFGFLGVDPDASVEMERVYNRGGVPRNRLFARLLRMRRTRDLVQKAMPSAHARLLTEWLRESASKPTPLMDPRTRERLTRLFEEDVLRLEGMIGRDLSHWRAIDKPPA